jgi:NAD(P)-dependent dehydrogenase (short-subunit alcohol dehydrogenase family)
MPGALVIGAGPGIGLAVARRFAREGLPMGVVARSQATVEAALAALQPARVPTYGATADAADETALRGALDGFVRRLGVPDVLVYNAAVIQWDPIGELDADGHLRAWAVNVVGAITAAAHLLPRMADAGHGTYLITGGMPTPLVGVTSLSLGKAGVRALAELLDAQYRPAGVHVATVTVGGAVSPGGTFDPDEIAEEYWRLHAQPAAAWEREVLFAGRAA